MKLAIITAVFTSFANVYGHTMGAPHSHDTDYNFIVIAFLLFILGFGVKALNRP